MATKNKKKLSRTQKKVEKIKENLNIKEQEGLSEEDYKVLLYQCEKFKDAAEVGRVSSSIAKFAVYYKRQWFFVTYDRVNHKVSRVFDITFLKTEEHENFLRFKNRVEMEERIKVAESTIKPATVIRSANDSRR